MVLTYEVDDSSACTMQHSACINSFNILWILQEGSFLHSSFWWESFLKISNHWPMKWLKLICIFGLYELIKLFDLCWQRLGWHNYPVLTGFRTSLALKLSKSLSSVIEFRSVWLVSVISTFKLLEIYLSDHVQTSLVDDCARGIQGVQLLDRLNPDQVWTIRFWRV